MKRLLNRLLVTDTGTETTDHTDEKQVSDSVEWRDISVETNGPTGWDSDTDPEERGLSEPETPFETLDVDQLVGTILDGVAVPTLVVDQAGEIVSINSAACERFETDEATAIGATPTTVHGGQQLFGQVLLAGEEITDRRETVDGGNQTISRTLKPLTDESGEIIGAVETVREVFENADSTQ